MQWAAVSTACCLLVLAACAAPAPRQPSPTPSPPPLPSPTVAGTPVVVAAVEPRPVSAAPAPVVVRPVASPSPAVLPLALLAGRNGADVRVALNLLLQEQVFLTAMATDAAASARLDELDASLGALDQNSLVFAEIIGAVKGPTSAQVLLEAWRGVVADLVAYAQGQPSAANTDLERRRPIVAAQLAMGDLSTSAADDLLRSRLQAQLSLADSIVAHAPTQSVPRLRSAAAASDALAQPLAAAISGQAPTQAAPPTDGLDVDVRVGLARALQEHALLTGAALDAAADGRAADQQALLSAADQNAADLGTQLGSVYGPDLGSGLADRLHAESAALVSAASGGDRRQAASDVNRLRGEIDRLLSDANQLLPPGLLNQELRASDQALLAAADAFYARDLATAYARLRESARQTQKAADSIALSIIDRHPGRYLVLPTPVPDN